LPDASCGRFSRCRPPERSRVFVFGPRIKGLIKGYLSSHPSGESAPQTGDFFCPPVVAAVAAAPRLPIAAPRRPRDQPGLVRQRRGRLGRRERCAIDPGQGTAAGGLSRLEAAFKWASVGRDVWAVNDNSVWPALGASPRRRAGLTITNFARCNFKKFGNDSTRF
jgi:hypothetical protein